LPASATAGTVSSVPAEVAKVEPEAKPSGTAPEKKFVAYKSILEKFKELPSDSSTPEGLMALFKPDSQATYKQVPQVALTDGESSLELTVRLSDSGDKAAPNFALNNASLVSLKRTEDGAGWIIKVLPRKEAHDASLTISQESVISMIPLTV